MNSVKALMQAREIVWACVVATGYKMQIPWSARGTRTGRAPQ